MKRLLAGTETGGTFCLFENRSSGPSQTPVHVHSDDDETIYVIDGEMTAIIAGQTSTAKKGEAIFLPRGIPHQLMNVAGAPAHYVLLCTPSGFEGFVAEAGRLRSGKEKVTGPSAEEIGKLKEAAPKFGITLLPGW